MYVCISSGGRKTWYKPQKESHVKHVNGPLDKKT